MPGSLLGAADMIVHKKNSKLPPLQGLHSREGDRQQISKQVVKQDNFRQ